MVWVSWLPTSCIPLLQIVASGLNLLEMSCYLVDLVLIQDLEGLNHSMLGTQNTSRGCDTCRR